MTYEWIEGWPLLIDEQVETARYRAAQHSSEAFVLHANTIELRRVALSMKAHFGNDDVTRLLERLIKRLDRRRARMMARPSTRTGADKS
jgi:hypothetical protein